MSDFTSIFNELLDNIKDLNRRLTNLETWEPLTGEDAVRAHAYLSTNFTASASVWDTVTFDKELWDTHNIHSGGVITVPSNGFYLVNTLLNYQSFVGTLKTHIQGSDTTILSEWVSDGSFTSSGIVSVYELDAGETLEVQVYRVGTGVTVLGYNAFPYWSCFQIEKIG